MSAVNGLGVNVGVPTAGTYGHLALFSDGHYGYAADNSAAAGPGTDRQPPARYLQLYGQRRSTAARPAPRSTSRSTRGPDAAADTATAATGIGGTASGNVLANDSDADGDVLAAAAGTVPGSHGTLVLGADGERHRHRHRSDRRRGQPPARHLQLYGRRWPRRHGRRRARHHAQPRPGRGGRYGRGDDRHRRHRLGQRARQRQRRRRRRPRRGGGHSARIARHLGAGPGRRLHLHRHRSDRRRGQPPARHLQLYGQRWPRRHGRRRARHHAQSRPGRGSQYGHGDGEPRRRRSTSPACSAPATGTGTR